MDNKEKESIISSLINILIRGEWETVENYNNTITTLSGYDGTNNVLAVLEDILDEEYAHIGQLESCLSLLEDDPTEQINDGEEEGAEQLELPEEDEPVEFEDTGELEESLLIDIEYPITDDRDAEDNKYYNDLYLSLYGRH